MLIGHFGILQKLIQVAGWWVMRPIILVTRRNGKWLLLNILDRVIGQTRILRINLLQVPSPNSPYNSMNTYHMQVLQATHMIHRTQNHLWIYIALKRSWLVCLSTFFNKTYFRNVQFVLTYHNVTNNFSSGLIDFLNIVSCFNKLFSHKVSNSSKDLTDILT